MSQHETYGERHPEVQAAIEDAKRLVEQSHGSNLDPIVEALDQRTLDDAGQVRQDLVDALRQDITTVVDLHAGERLTGRQVAARLLCRWDDRLLVPILAATDGGVDELVPVIAVTVFGVATPAVLSVCSALAALVDVQGLQPFCEELDSGMPVDRLGPSI